MLIGKHKVNPKSNLQIFSQVCTVWTHYCGAILSKTVLSQLRVPLRSLYQRILNSNADSRWLYLYDFFSSCYSVSQCSTYEASRPYNEPLLASGCMDICLSTVNSVYTMLLWSVVFVDCLYKALHPLIIIVCLSFWLICRFGFIRTWQCGERRQQWVFAKCWLAR